MINFNRFLRALQMLYSKDIYIDNEVIKHKIEYDFFLKKRRVIE